jgi:gamma-glutamyltranspeptidase/glutathione hydrolase
MPLPYFVAPTPLRIMTRRYDRRSFLQLSGGALAASLTPVAIGAERKGNGDGHGLVVGHPEAAEAGMRCLADGGNAIDAIVTAALVAGVVAVSRCGIGGYGGHMTIGLSSGKVASIDFNSEAPKGARADMFPLDEKGNVKGNINKHGWLAAGVPATLAGVQLALDNYGSMPFSRAVQPAIRYARDGFRLTVAPSDFMRHDPGSAKLFTRNGSLLAKGATFRNPDLAKLLEKLADKGSVDDFYRGDIARQIAAAFKKNGGLVTFDDMASYHPFEDKPLTMEWDGYSIATAPLTAGGLTVLQTIGALKALGSDWKRLDKNSPHRTQAWLEALRISWGDRLQLFGDPRQVDVPVERLLSKKYAEASAEKVRTAVANKRPVPVTTDDRTTNGTVNLAAVDRHGMMAVMTLTHGESFGAQVTVDGLGLILGHGNSRFDPVPGRPNSIAPRKRPLDNMCPTIVLKDGKPMYGIGAVGGRRIPNAVFQVLMKIIEDGSSLEEAVADPRLHTEGGMLIRAEAKRPRSDIDYLKQIGYKFDKPLICWVSGVQAESANERASVGVADFGEDHPGSIRNPMPAVTRSN